MSDITTAATAGERMARARAFAGLDQVTIAQLIGCSRSSVSAWERGVTEPPFSAVAQWSRITGRTLDWIAFGHGNDEAPSDESDEASAVRLKGLEPPTF